MSTFGGLLCQWVTNRFYKHGSSLESKIKSTICEKKKLIMDFQTINYSKTKNKQRKVALEKVMNY